MTRQDDSQARAAAHHMAREWTDLVGHEQRASQIAVEYVGKVERRFVEMLAQVYRDPPAARHAFDLAQVNAGGSAAWLHSPVEVGEDVDWPASTIIGAPRRTRSGTKR